MKPRTIRLGLPTGRRVEVRADLSIRVMLRAGLLDAVEDVVVLDLLDGVLLDDRAQARRLQDALVMHALDTTKPAELHGLADEDFSTILDYVVTRLTGSPDEEEAEDEAEDAEEVLGVSEPEAESPALSWEEEVEQARAMSLPEPAGLQVPASAEVLEHAEAEA